MAKIKPGQLSSKSCDEKLSMTLAWLDMSRDELLEVLSKASREDKQRLFGNLGSAMASLSDAIDCLRVILGLEPELNDEED